MLRLSSLPTNLPGISTAVLEARSWTSSTLSILREQQCYWLLMSVRWPNDTPHGSFLCAMASLSRIRLRCRHENRRPGGTCGTQSAGISAAQLADDNWDLSRRSVTGSDAFARHRTATPGFLTLSEIRAVRQRLCHVRPSHERARRSQRKEERTSASAR